MNPSGQWLFTLIFFIGIQGLVVSCILFFVNRNQSLSPRLLAIYLFMISIMSLHIGLTYTSFFLSFPNLWRITSFASLCAPVIAYMYVRSVLYQNFRLQKNDWLFFIPALFHLISFVPFYVKSRAEKLVIISNVIADKSLIAKEPEGILPVGWGIAFRLLLGICFLAAQYVLLIKMGKKITTDEHPVSQNKTTYRWLLIFTVVLSLLYFFLIIEHFIHINQSYDLSTSIIFTISGTILFINIYLLLRPNILYGIQGWVQKHQLPEQPAVEQDISEDIIQGKKTTLSIDQGAAYKAALENHFRINQPFRKSGYKIRDLSEEMNIPSYVLSAFINQEYGKNFNELINDYRVDFMAGQLKESPEKLQFTLDALAREAGFNSRNSFFTAVKKKTGRTPSEFFGTRRTAV